ncbi:MAG: BBE domain-containing protein, partial [Verrucomicrobia bacterium]|nr:BBE domain-containing protein [Verrucomicrobiota bacterium]
TFIGALRSASSQIATIFEAYGGSINRVGETDTAFPHRGNTLFCLQYYLQWPSSSSTNRNVAAVRALYDAMRPYLSGFSYVNYIDADLQDYARSYYKGNLSRLQAVKQQYDPDNFFHFAHSIPLPAGLNSGQQTDTKDGLK